MHRDNSEGLSIGEPSPPVAVLENQQEKHLVGDLVNTRKIEPIGLPPLSAGWEVATLEDGGPCYHH